MESELSCIFIGALCGVIFGFPAGMLYQRVRSISTLMITSTEMGDSSLDRDWLRTGDDGDEGEEIDLTRG